MTPKKRIRKPSPLKPYRGSQFRASVGNGHFVRDIFIDLPPMSAKEARRLAVWLEKAADFLEQKEKRK